MNPYVLIPSHPTGPLFTYMMIVQRRQPHHQHVIMMTHWLGLDDPQYPDTIGPEYFERTYAPILIETCPPMRDRTVPKTFVPKNGAEKVRAAGEGEGGQGKKLGKRKRTSTMTEAEVVQWTRGESSLKVTLSVSLFFGFSVSSPSRSRTLPPGRERAASSPDHEAVRQGLRACYLCQLPHSRRAELCGLVGSQAEVASDE